MSSLYLVRHGQASLGASNYDQLSAVGREQSTLLGQHFQALNLRFEHVFSGSLNRQVDTAQGVLSAYHAANAYAPALRKDKRFDEYDFEPILKTYAFVKGLDAIPIHDPRQFFVFLQAALTAWVEGALSSPAIPPWRQFADRCEAALRDAASAASRDSRVLVVTSGGVIAAILCHVLGTEPKRFVDLNLAIRNAAITRVERTHTGWSLSSFNAMPHLEQPSRRHLITLA